MPDGDHGGLAPQSDALNVLITVDTEYWPDPLRPHGLKEAIDRDLWGITPRGEYGVRYQAEVLQEHGLKAVFHLEALSASAPGVTPHEEAIGTLGEYGQEVQLHLHTEWLERGVRMLPGRTGQHMRHFTVDEQVALLQKGLDLLRRSGAHEICAFRAGNFGANWDTLRGLAEVGIRFDTSYNHCYQGMATRMEGIPHFLQPRQMYGVYEFPVSYFQDRPGHYRPVHLTACSISELIHALEQAHAATWKYFVIVSHSFELIDRPRLRPDPVVVRRFRRLCRYLEQNRERFRTVGFLDIQGPVHDSRPLQPLRSSVLRTVRRVAEQAWRQAPF